MKTVFERTVRHWLIILRDCNINLDRYLQRERDIYEGTTISYYSSGRCGDTGKQILFPTGPLQAIHSLSIQYVERIGPQHENYSLILAFKSLMNISHYDFEDIFLNSYESSSWDRERNKEIMREFRERNGKPVCMPRYGRKLLSRLADSVPCWSKARFLARPAIEAGDTKVKPPSIDNAHGSRPVTNTKYPALFAVFHIFGVQDPDSVFLRICILLLALSVGANIVLWNKWVMASWYWKV
jgi:hypothetical protein